jgi:protein-tyrosine phosphatase
VKLFLPFAGVSEAEEIPDPYYGGPQGFEFVLDLLEAGCSGMLKCIGYE